ncbi:alpha-ketoacid dehydrogenase subunit alpha/beta [Nocardioides immobilis]|nr:alpha-ketoacid dehydrogenase subunit alpha/beta [Nocardioides immobilis]
MSYELTPNDTYRRMAYIRAFEEQVLELGREGEVVGSVHLALGQEAIPVGAMAALEAQDRVLATYRGHGWALACGSDPRGLMAEIAQREAGVNGGRAGSPMLSDPDVGFLGENSIIGAHLPIGTGVALASQIAGETRVVIVSLGDGAMNQGSTTEAMIFAAAKNLPVIFLCENNGWSEMTPIGTTTRGEHLARRGQGLCIESVIVDGGDPVAVCEAVSGAAEQCRRGEGPVLLECKTVRLSGHYNKDIQHYRGQDDIDAAAEEDPLLRMREMGAISAEEAATIEAEVKAEVAHLAEEVRGLSAPSADTALSHLYGPDPAGGLAGAEGDVNVKEIPYFRAVNEALRWAMTNCPEVIVYGEDVGVAGGIFGVTRGLQKEFGSERVFDTPIAEAAILGSAVGAAMHGLRPVVEIMWADFVFVALDQIVNQAANVRYVNRSKLSAPLVVRMQQGFTPGSCAQHSQSIEAILSHIPGIKVGMPSTPQDAYAMTLAAINDPDPVVQIEHRAMYQNTGEVRLGSPSELARGARVQRDGSDVAIISWGSMVGASLEAAEILAGEGIEALVLDLRWLRPLDDEAIASAVRRAGGHVLVVHEAVLTGGFGAEIAARIAERHFETLAGPVHRLATPDVRMPSAPNLQQVLIPNASDVADLVRKLLGR